MTTEATMAQAKRRRERKAKVKAPQQLLTYEEFIGFRKAGWPFEMLVDNIDTDDFPSATITPLRSAGSNGALS
jgi:hypothetical protein